MNINSNNTSILQFNPFIINKEKSNMQQKSILNKIENNMKQKSDILEISKQSILKLKVRNLEKATELEKKSDEMKQKLEQKLNLYQSVASTLKDAQKLIKQSTDKDISVETKKGIQSKLDTMLKDVADIVDETIKNNKVENISTTNSDVEKIELIEKNNDHSIPIDHTKDTQKIDIGNIDILKDPSKASLMIGMALTSVMEEIGEMTSELCKLQKNIDKLLGKDMDKKEIKDINKINNNKENIEQLNNVDSKSTTKSNSQSS